LQFPGARDVLEACACGRARGPGGDLVFGVRERRDADGKATGEIDAIVGLAGLNFDAERLRLEAMIRDGIAPRMPPVAFRGITRDGKPPCILLRIRAVGRACTW
jgi:hypothetical protein